MTCLNIPREERCGIEIIDRDIEETLYLHGMEVNRQDAVRPGFHQQIRDKLGANGRAGPDLRS